jgi:hypothetical protein
MTEPELDKNRPVTTHRTLTGAKYSQDGHMFSLAGVYTGPDPSYVSDEPEVEVEEVISLPVDDGKAGVLARATAKLEGFSDPDDLSDAKKENTKAAAAERLAS